MENAYIVFVRTSLVDEHWEAICVCNTEELAHKLVDLEVERTGNDRSDYWINELPYYDEEPVDDNNEEENISDENNEVEEQTEETVEEEN